MKAHPLRGMARWLVYPLLAVGAGAVSGVFLAHADHLDLLPYMLAGGVLGGAVACGFALWAEAWMSLLVAPVLGTVGILMAKVVTSMDGWTWSWVLTETLPGLLKEPGPIVFSFVMTAPIVVLHGIRLRRQGPWRRGWLVYAGAALLFWMLGSLLGGRAPWTLLIFLALFYLGSRVALEAALALSGPQLGKPSNRTASS